MSESKNIFSKVVDAFRKNYVSSESDAGVELEPVLPFSEDFTEISRVKDSVRCFVFALNDYLDMVDDSTASLQSKAQCVRRLRYWYTILLREVGLDGKKR